MANANQLDAVLSNVIQRIAEAVADRLAEIQRSTQQPSVPDGLVDEPEMAKRLNISQQSLQRRRKAGVVPHVPCGRRVLYRPDDVIAALKSQSEKGGSL